MAKKKRSWLAKLIWPQPARRSKPRVQGFRNLTVERLESRQMLSGTPSLSDLLIALTPDPHPSGDMPADVSQLVPLVNYAEGLVPPDMPSYPDVHNFVVGLEQVYSDIANNADARPAYWGESTAGGANQFRIHLDDNGMLVTNWTIDWGDGSDPQTVQPQPWVVHQYPTAGNYTVSVTANSRDGTFTAGSTSFTDLAGIGGSGDGGLQVSLSDVPPTLHVAGTQTAALGSTFALDNLVSVSAPDQANLVDGTSVTQDYSYSIDWGDSSVPFTGGNIDVISAGGNGDPFMGALRSDTADGLLTHVYSDPGAYNLNVTVTNISSGLSDTQTIPINIAVLAPSITATGLSGNSCDEGTAVGFSASVTADASLSDPIGYNWQIADSEGNVVAQGTDLNLNYTFTYPDTYTVSLVASVDNVQSTAATEIVTVNNVAPSFVLSTLPNLNASVGQVVTLPSIAFTDPGLSDTHTATIDWGDSLGVTTSTITEPSADGSAPGLIDDSYAYATPDNYTATVTLTDDSGAVVTKTFNVDVVSATVALTDFAPSSDGSQLNVSYTVTGATAAPFTIGIYTSPDGVTPDQLLQSVTVDGSTYLPLTAGSDTASFTPQFDDVQSNYHLIAMADANATNNAVEFDGGVFYAQSVTASPPQNILYVFGSNSANLYGGGDTIDIYGPADGAPNSVAFNSASSPYGSISNPPITGIHVRGEAGNDDIEVESDVTLPLWLIGSSGTNMINDAGSGADLLIAADGATTITHTGVGNATINGGAGITTITTGPGNDTINFGTGQTALHEGNGQASPEVLDDSDGTRTGITNAYTESGTGWSSPGPSGFDQGQRVNDGSDSSATATWTFGNLDPTAYYNVYVTWSADAGASTGTVYSVSQDGGTTWQTLTGVNQTQAPADYQAAGTYWHDLGVFQATSGSLNIRLSASTGEVLADAAMIAPNSLPAVTNLTIGTFTVDSQGNLSVSYTITGEDAPPFSIGIYQSADGVQPGALAGTIDVTDQADLSGGGTTHTLEYGGTLFGLANGQYYIAQLDCYSQVQELTRTDNTSSPLTGIFETGDGSLYALTALNGGSHTLVFSQDTLGDVLATLDGVTSTFQNVSTIYAVTYHGANTIDSSGVTVPSELYGGDGPDTICSGSAGAIESPVPDEVMIGSVVPVGSDFGGQAGEFQVTRVGDTSATLLVNVSLGGTLAGADYTLSEGGLPLANNSIMIPAGESSVTINVTPVSGATGSDPTINLTLDSGIGYSVVGGDSGATVTVRDEDDLSTVPVEINFYAPDGTNEGSGGGTVFGDFIPMDVEVSPDNPEGTTYKLCYSNSDAISVSSSPGGSPIAPGTEISGDTTYYVSATAAAISAGQNVSSTISVDAYEGTSLYSSYSADAELGPLKMDDNGIDVTSGPPQNNPASQAKVGQIMNFTVNDSAGTSGLVVWSEPQGVTVKNYQPIVNGQTANSCTPVYLTYLDLLAVKVSNLNIVPLSFAWVDGGNNRTETATLISPFGISSAKATFNVLAPSANARVDMEDFANNPDQTAEPNMNFYPLGQGQNGMNTFEATYTDPGVPGAIPPHTVAVAVAGFFGADPADDLRSFTPGAQFIATPTNMAERLWQTGGFHFIGSH